MCPPDYFDVNFMFNPWLKYDQKVDKQQAVEQWERLVRTLEDAGADVEFMGPSEISGAQVFTADGALVYDHEKALILRNDGPRGVAEPRLFVDWLEEHGFQTESLPPKYHLDGGNILRIERGSYLVGIKPGSPHGGERYLAKMLRLVSGASVQPIHLVDEKYLHLDMVVGRLGDKGYLVFESGVYGERDEVQRSPLAQRDIIPIDEEDARNFACNAITVNGTLITGQLTADTKHRIQGLGLWVEELPLTEFYKAGGGAKCLTLPLNP
jgi:N-dimethylarginine dimethylaminohydrolase